MGLNLSSPGRRTSGGTRGKKYLRNQFSTLKGLNNKFFFDLPKTLYLKTPILYIVRTRTEMSDNEQI